MTAWVRPGPDVEHPIACTTQGMPLARPPDMSRAQTVLTPLMTLLVVVGSGTVARADPIRVTSGVVAVGFGEVAQPLIGEGLQLIADGFTMSTSLEDPGALLQLAVVPTVTAGALVDFSGVLHATEAMSAQLSGSFVRVAPFTMSFAASPTRITCSSANSVTQCAGVAPFTFDANLTLTSADGATTTRQLIGDGTVEGLLFDTGSFQGVSVRYAFGASPTPEPATLSLFATGVLAAAWRRRRGPEVHLQ